MPRRHHLTSCSTRAVQPTRIMGDYWRILCCSLPESEAIYHRGDGKLRAKPDGSPMQTLVQRLTSCCAENRLFIRPLDIRVRLYQDSFFVLYFSPSNLRDDGTERNHIHPHDRKLVRFENALPKSVVSPPLQIGGFKTTFFDDFVTTAILTAYIFE